MRRQVIPRQPHICASHVAPVGVDPNTPDMEPARNQLVLLLLLLLLARNGVSWAGEEVHGKTPACACAARKEAVLGACLDLAALARLDAAARTAPRYAISYSQVGRT